MVDQNSPSVTESVNVRSPSCGDKLVFLCQSCSYSQVPIIDPVPIGGAWCILGNIPREERFFTLLGGQNDVGSVSKDTKDSGVSPERRKES